MMVAQVAEHWNMDEKDTGSNPAKSQAYFFYFLKIIQISGASKVKF